MNYVIGLGDDRQARVGNALENVRIDDIAIFDLTQAEVCQLATALGLTSSCGSAALPRPALAEPRRNAAAIMHRVARIHNLPTSLFKGRR